MVETAKTVKSCENQTTTRDSGHTSLFVVSLVVSLVVCRLPGHDSLDTTTLVPLTPLPRNGSGVRWSRC